MPINDNLRQLRLDSGMTQEQVAEKIGITRQAISSYESGRTRPDIDTLMQLGDIYGTDLDGIVYGESRVLKSIKLIKATARITLISLVILTIISSALLWSANHFFPVPEGQLSSEEMIIFTSHQRLTDAWSAVDAFILMISPIGFALLLVLRWSGKCTLSAKSRINYILTLAASLLGIAILFGATDPVFRVVYLITPGFVVQRMVLFGAIDAIIEFIQRKRKNI